MEEMEVLSCGCVLTSKIEDGVKVFQLAPCNIDCKVIDWVLKASDEENKPVEYRYK